MKRPGHDSWLARNLELVEKTTTLVLLLFGLGLLLLSHFIADNYPLFGELTKEVGFACLVALCIKYINEIFLRKKIEISFQRQRQQVAKDVLSSVFEKLIPLQLFSEIKKTILSGLKFMRDQFKITYRFYIEDGKLHVTSCTLFRIQNTLDVDTIYPLRWGVDKEQKWTRKNVAAYYCYDGQSDTSDVQIPIDSVVPSPTSKFGGEHDEFTFDIPFPRKYNRLVVKLENTYVYNNSEIKEDNLKSFFLIPTSNVSIVVQDHPPNMTFSLSEFGSDSFREMQHPAPNKKYWKYSGCFYPNQGYILHWNYEV